MRFHSIGIELHNLTASDFTGILSIINIKGFRTLRCFFEAKKKKIHGGLWISNVANWGMRLADSKDHTVGYNKSSFTNLSTKY